MAQTAELSKGGLLSAGNQPCHSGLLSSRSSPIQFPHPQFASSGSESPQGKTRWLYRRSVDPSYRSQGSPRNPTLDSTFLRWVAEVLGDSLFGLSECVKCPWHFEPVQLLSLALPLQTLADPFGWSLQSRFSVDCRERNDRLRLGRCRSQLRRLLALPSPDQHCSALFQAAVSLPAKRLGHPRIDCRSIEHGTTVRSNIRNRPKLQLEKLLASSILAC